VQIEKVFVDRNEVKKAISFAFVAACDFVDA